MMVNEQLIDAMNEYLKASIAQRTLSPCSEDDIIRAENAFQTQFGQPLPEAYKDILRRSNGVLHNGLVIWPAIPDPLFRETILEANEDPRDSFSDQFLYFAQRDEELYVYDIVSKKYRAIEYVGKPAWAEFGSCEELFNFALERAWE